MNIGVLFQTVLKTLKLSSEIQASEQELKMALDQEKELHNRTKSDQETLAARLLRTENDCQRLQHQYDTVNQEYVSCNDKYNIAQSKERTLSLDVDILNRKNNALTIDYERALKNMKDMHEELLMTKNDKRKHSDRVDTLARSCKEITLDLEREQNAHRKLQEEFQQVGWSCVLLDGYCFFWLNPFIRVLLMLDLALLEIQTDTAPFCSHMFAV